jgi:hypothetical protein
MFAAEWVHAYYGAGLDAWSAAPDRFGMQIDTTTECVLSRALATVLACRVHRVSPAWRPHLAAAATCSFLGPDAPDTALIEQVREAVEKS